MSDMSKKTIKENSKSKKIELCIDPNEGLIYGFIDEGEEAVRENDSRLKEDDEKEGDAVVENPALREAAKEFNDSLLDELQDRLERQTRVYDRIFENMLDELDRLRGRIKELESSLLEKDEVLDDVIEELAAKERQLSAVRGVIDFDVNIKRDEP